MATTIDSGLVDIINEPTQSVDLLDWSNFRKGKAQREGAVLHALSSPVSQPLIVFFDTSDSPLYGSDVSDSDKVAGVTLARVMHQKIHGVSKVEDTGEYLGRLPWSISLTVRVPVADAFDATAIAEIHRLIGGMLAKDVSGTLTSLIPEFLHGGSEPAGTIG